jgi:hypothetical protein
MDKIVLICATGRSGSTTLQRLLNTIPNSNFCGENFGALISLLEFYKRLKYSSTVHIHGRFNPTAYDKLIENKIKPAWYNSYDFIKTSEMIRQLIINLFKDDETTNIWGFKEIRYDSNNILLIKEFKELFPQTKVIIQLRDIKSQMKSGWFKGDKSAVNHLLKTNIALYNFYLKNRDFVYFTTFHKMFDKQNLRDIFRYIDCEEHFDEKKIDEVLNNNLKD